MVNSTTAGKGQGTRRSRTAPGRPRKSLPGWSGGALCLNFAETLEYRPSRFHKESLNSYADLLSWGVQMGVMTDLEADRLANEAITRPKEAAEVLDRALALREAIYGVFLAVAGGAQPSEADLATLNVTIGETLVNLRIVPTAGGFARGWAERRDALDSVLWPVVWSTLDLLTSEKLALVRECTSPDCSSLFIDTSKNHSRRWCNMKVCGNRAKAIRHYQRKK